ncbi:MULTISPECIES: hypothetical protein [Nocardia]|uniref:Uncharacterized protein n=3 Tax=Nocardia TaxID=1817 RepID=A0A7G1KG68_9NOCA|nr:MULTISPECIES: hypothetical protein [Nocardia]MBF6295503.1 hypothetical protein [Nocardia farcinica]MBF6362348.1 hypothetical protein [Nocardia farcinica]MBF6381888.1 hypothetical protein [Nocardia farcinica]MBF6445604.1 hypothetical protein [Nocardia farcinica]MBF6451914.1 hypothetical protein [Nocardia cyriacigeorgica]
MERRLVVDFDIPGVPVQHYRAERCAAEAFAAEATRQGLARVTVDDLATDEMKQLPYQRLFLPSRRDDHTDGLDTSTDAAWHAADGPHARHYLH